MKYQLSEDGTQITKEDGKVVANIAGGEITPTAPVYYKFLDEFRLLLDDGEADMVEEPAIEAGGDEEVETVNSAEEIEEIVSPERVVAATLEDYDQDSFEVLTGKAIHQARTMTDWGDDPEPKTEKRWGLKTPGYPSWLQRNDPAKAAEIYKGRNVAEYEEACKITN